MFSLLFLTIINYLYNPHPILENIILFVAFLEFLFECSTLLIAIKNLIHGKV